jgi:hypothetical protein
VYCVGNAPSLAEVRWYIVDKISAMFVHLFPTNVFVFNRYDPKVVCPVVIIVLSGISLD